jgi:phenylalanyl-tRNA synthetase beta chain
MKFSVNIAQYYSDIDFKSIPKDELVTRMGLQLGAIESFTDYAPKYKDIIVVKVVECVKHPDADKLSLCRVDDGGMMQHVERGDDGLVQVVCGAPNVHANMFAAWIPPGATVPASFDTDPFVLEARELRGKVSNGMLASKKELDISDEHDGILEILESDVEHAPIPGESVAPLYGLDDFVVDCENKMFTHRPDCFGNLGIAREVAGIFGKKYASPDWYTTLPKFETFEEVMLTSENQVPTIVPRIMTVAMKNITVKPSPIWLQAYLKRVGIKPINNIVDVTNYVMHLTAQPLHAFDLDKLASRSDNLGVFPRMAKKGEKLLLLGNKEVTLTPEDIVIATDRQAVALAGVMGGAETEVDENTKNILIECANFDMYTVRRTSMRHGLFTEAVTRFNKGQSPKQNPYVLAYAMKAMNDHAGALQASSVTDAPLVETNQGEMSFRLADGVRGPMGGPEPISIAFINERLGTSLTIEDVCTLLENVEFNASQKDNAELFYWAPYWRMDISIPEDIVEEVGRLYGYEKLPVVLPARTSKPASRNELFDFSRELAKKLVKAGANELLTYTFVHGDLLKNTGTDPEKWAFHLRNALSPELQFYRTSVLPSLLAKVYANIKAQAGSDENEFALFEIGKAHVKGEQEVNEALPKQMRRLAFAYAADQKTAKTRSGAAYYQAKHYVDFLTNGQAKYIALDTNEYPITAPFQLGRSAVILVNDQMLGVVGEFTHKAKAHMKLPDFCAGFELDIDLLRSHISREQYKPLSNYPGTEQDMTLEVDELKTWQHIEEFLHAELAVAKAESGYEYEIEPLDIYQPEESDKKRITFRVRLTHHAKTLKTDEINLLFNHLAEASKEALDATRI